MVRKETKKSDTRILTAGVAHSFLRQSAVLGEATAYLISRFCVALPGGHLYCLNVFGRKKKERKKGKHGDLPRIGRELSG